MLNQAINEHQMCYLLCKLKSNEFLKQKPQTNSLIYTNHGTLKKFHLPHIDWQKQWKALVLQRVHYAKTAALPQVLTPFSTQFRIYSLCLMLNFQQ